MPPLRYDWAYRAQARAAALAGHRQRRHRDAWKRPAQHLDACRRRDARPRRVSRSLPAASARCRLVRRRSCARAASCCARMRPYVEAQLARGVYLKHITRHLLGLFAGERGGRAFRQVLSEGAHKPGADWSLVEQALALTESFMPTRRSRRRMITRDTAGLPRPSPAAARPISARPPRAPRSWSRPTASASPSSPRRTTATWPTPPRFDAARASAQHRDLHRAFAAGAADGVLRRRSADARRAVPQQRVRAPAAGRYVVGRMRHPVRQREATRADIRGFFGGVLDYAEIDLSTQPHPCELTGALVIDRARGLGFCGLSERCDEDGARLMHEAFGLRATLLFDLAPGEYHTNVVLAVLAGRAALVCPRRFRRSGRGRRHRAPCTRRMRCCCRRPSTRPSPAMRSRCRDDGVWMSARAGRALTPAHREALAAAGFEVAHASSWMRSRPAVARCAAASARSSEAARLRPAPRLLVNASRAERRPRCEGKVQTGFTAAFRKCTLAVLAVRYRLASPSWITAAVHLPARLLLLLAARLPVAAGDASAQGRGHGGNATERPRRQAAARAA